MTQQWLCGQFGREGGASVPRQSNKKAAPFCGAVERGSRSQDARALLPPCPFPPCGLRKLYPASGPQLTLLSNGHNAPHTKWASGITKEGAKNARSWAECP